LSKLYQWMHSSGHIDARRLPYAKKSRQLRIVDRTGDSPLMIAPSAANWYVAMAEPRRELAARVSLMEGGWKVWYPQETIWRENAAKRQKVKLNVPLFARYIFVAGDGHKPIGDCRHVSVLLPYRVPSRLIRDLEARQNGGEFQTSDPPPYSEGQRVTANLGFITALNGIVRQANHERVRILTEMLGSVREIEIPVEMVSAA
jgi:Transcription termination factor nusG